MRVKRPCADCRCANLRTKYKNDEQFKEKQRLRNRSESGKEAKKKYKQSEKGRKAQKRSNKSESGKKAAIKYKRSKKGKKAQNRYNESEKGAEARRKYESSVKGKAVKKQTSEIYEQRPYVKTRRKSYKASPAGKEAERRWQQSEKGKNYNSNWRQNKYLTDMNYKLRVILRSRLNSALRGKSKSGSAVGDLGCSIAELKTYLESKFKPGMSWDNWGDTKKSWHIDHICPLSFFDLEDRQQLLKACHYTNLQPLWKIENLKKGSKIYPQNNSRYDGESKITDLDALEAEIEDQAREDQLHEEIQPFREHQAFGSYLRAYS